MEEAVTAPRSERESSGRGPPGAETYITPERGGVAVAYWMAEKRNAAVQWKLAQSPRSSELVESCLQEVSHRIHCATKPPEGQGVLEAALQHLD